jgi:hypothetical protein
MLALFDMKSVSAARFGNPRDLDFRAMAIVKAMRRHGFVSS